MDFRVLFFGIFLCKLFPFCQSINSQFQFKLVSLEELHYPTQINSFYVFQERIVECKMEGSKIVFLSSNVTGVGMTIDNNNICLYMTIFDMNSIPPFKFKGRATLPNSSISQTYIYNIKLLSVNPIIIAVNSSIITRVS